MHLMMKFGLALVLLLGLGLDLTEAAPTFPTLSGRVVDEAGLLSPGARQAITAQLAAHENATSNQVVVVTLADLQGYTIEDYGYQLGRHWGIGQAKLSNGVLLIIAPKERKVRIEVGYGLEGTLTDALSHDIIQNRILPRFRQQQFEAGITEGVNSILAVLQGSYTPVSKKSRPSQSQDLGVGTFISLFMFFLIVGELSSLWLRSRLRSGLTLAAVAFIAGWIFISMAGGFILAMLLFLMHQFVGGGGGPGASGGSGRYHDRHDYSGRGYGSYGGGYSGGGGFGGGFSGGGGSFGGGGASGGW